jgi:hypothetical protein
MKTNKERIIEKYKMLSEKQPLGVDLKNIDPIGLYNESQNDNILKHRLTRFGQIFRSLEGLKQFVVPYYNSHSDKIHSFRDAIFYNELVQIQVFFEFINNIQTDSSISPNLNRIVQNKNNQRLNKIRNSIAHFDWTLNNGKIAFKDNNYEREEDYFEISEFCSLLSMIAIFMTNDINTID